MKPPSIRSIMKQSRDSRKDELEKARQVLEQLGKQSRDSRKT